MRLRKRFEYNNIRRIGKKYYGKHICFQYALSNKAHTKLGITVSRKFGGAIKRNYFKRRIREIFRKAADNFKIPIRMNILPLQSSKTASYEELSEDFKAFIEHIQKGIEDDIKA